MAKIHINELRKIIKEELINHLLSEGDQEDSAAEHTRDAAALLKALEKYQTSVSAKAKAEFGDNLDRTEKILKRIVGSPMSYVDPVVSDEDLTSAKSGEESSSSSEDEDSMLTANGPKVKIVKQGIVKKKTATNKML